MQGLAVVPLFAGYDLDAGRGRIFSYDVTGGRYEEHGHHSVGSGSLFARGSLKKLYRPTHDAGEAVRVAVEALYDAADDDSATGGPDLTRRIWPVVATVTVDGYRRVPEDELAGVVEAVVAGRVGDPGGSGDGGSRHEHAVLRLARAGDEGPGRLRAQGDRPRATRRGAPVRPRHRVRGREPVARPAQDQRDLRPRRVRRGGQVQRVREPPGRGRALRRPARVLLRPHRRHRARPRERLRADPRRGVHHREQAARGRAGGGAGRRRARRRPAVPDHLRRVGQRGDRVRRDGRRVRDRGGRHRRRLAAGDAAGRRARPGRARARHRPRRRRGPDPHGTRTSRSPCSTGSGRAGPSGAWRARCWSGCSQEDDPTDDVPSTDDPGPGTHETLTGHQPPPDHGTATQAQDTPPGQGTGPAQD